MSSPELVVKEAFDKFKTLIYESDNCDFQQTTLEDVRAAARIISRNQSQRNCLRNLHRLKPLFEILTKLSAAVDTLCQGTPYLCYIWAPIKLILLIADEYNESFDTITDAYEEIANHLPRLGRLGSTFADQPFYRSVVADVCSDILEFHSHAYQFLRRRGWKVLFDLSWKSFKTRFDTILRRLEKGRDLLDKEAASFDLLESRDFRHKILDDLEKRERERKEWQMRDSLSWLDLKGQDREQEALMERRAAAREPTTCTWILNNPQVLSWLSDDKSHDFLWLCGKPGSGKTTLATYLISEPLFPPKAMVLYCLCSYGFGKSESDPCSLMLRSLIAQVLRTNLELLPFVYGKYVSVCAVPSIGNYRQLLRDLLWTSETAFLVIDGIDECEPEHQGQIVSKLRELQQHGDNRVKIMICSRETKEINKKMSKVPKLSLTNAKKHIDRDISSFTIFGLTELQGRFEEATIEDVGKLIVRKANGMFLWVQLVMASLLDQGSVQDLYRTIDQLPAGLDAVYKSILDRLDRSSDDYQRGRVRFVLGLIASSYRPLKAWEVCDMITFHGEADTLNDQNKLPKDILNSCKPFIEELDGEVIQIVHFSAREFLFKTASGPYLRNVNVHTDVATVCIKYLLTCGSLIRKPSALKTTKDIVLGAHNLFRYVQEFWIAHLKDSVLGVLAVSAQDDRVRRLTALLDRLATLLQPGDIVSLVESPSIDESAPVIGLELLWTSLPPNICQYLNYKCKLTQLTIANDTIDANLTDPTLMTALYNNFTSILEDLLVKDWSPDLLSELRKDQIDEFKKRHGASAFLCPRIGCIWASIGFKTPAERTEHEKSHQKRFRCPETSCDSAVGGFPTKEALRKHKDKYHTVLTDIVLPPFPISASRGKAGQPDQGGRASVVAAPEIRNAIPNIDQHQQRPVRSFTTTSDPEIFPLEQQNIEQLQEMTNRLWQEGLKQRAAMEYGGDIAMIPPQEQQSMQQAAHYQAVHTQAYYTSPEYLQNMQRIQELQQQIQQLQQVQQERAQLSEQQEDQPPG